MLLLLVQLPIHDLAFIIVAVTAWASCLPTHTLNIEHVNKCAKH